MGVKAIVDALAEMKFENTFNPYFERCSVYDEEDAPALRKSILIEMLERAAKVELDAVWVGRDLGYRGGRRTGLALTDDVHMHEHLQRWEIDARRPTSGQPVPERTAAVIWDALEAIDAPIFLWNVFPLHPFAAGDPFSNRAHNAQERKAGFGVLLMLIEYLRPRRIVAIGNDAYAVLSAVLPAEDVTKVRHPSYGGQTEFLTQIRTIYGNGRRSQSDLFDTPSN